MLISHRLTLKFTLVIFFVLASLSAVAFYVFYHFRDEEYHKQLEEKVKLTSALLIQKDTINDDLASLINQHSLGYLFNEKITIFDEKNKIIYTTNDRIPNGLDDNLLEQIRKNKQLSFKYHDREGVGRIHQTNKHLFVITATAQDFHVYDELKNLLTSLIIANVIGVLVVALISWFLAIQALEPITEIVEQVKHISPVQFDFRLNEGNRKDEIAQLAMTFNDMLAKLQYSYEMKKNFVSNASHELRTPLANMLGTLETSYLYDDSLEKYKASIASAIEEIKDLIALTNELLNLTKFESEQDKSNTVPVPVRIDEVVLQIISDAKRKYPHHKIDLNFVLPEDSEAMTVLAAYSLLKISLWNIVDNACKYSNDKPVTVELWSEGQGSIKFKVSDQGIGISEEELRFIISPMFRGSNVKGIGGFGVGLSLTRTILERYNAKFYIDSKIGKGTRVTVIFSQIGINS